MSRFDFKSLFRLLESSRRRWGALGRTLFAFALVFAAWAAPAHANGPLSATISTNVTMSSEGAQIAINCSSTNTGGTSANCPSSTSTVPNWAFAYQFVDSTTKQVVSTSPVTQVGAVSYATTPTSGGSYLINLVYLYNAQTTFNVASTSTPIAVYGPAMLAIPDAAVSAGNDPNSAALAEVASTATRYNTFILLQTPNDGSEPGTFRIQNAITSKCLTTNVNIIGGVASPGWAVWDTCAGNSGTRFYLAPALRGFGFFIKPYNLALKEANLGSSSATSDPSFCLSTDTSGTLKSSSTWTPNALLCKDSIDSTDPLSDGGDPNVNLSNITWNFYTENGQPLPNGASLPQLTSASPVVNLQPNIIKECNWGAMGTYFTVTYTINGGASQSFQSGTVGLGTCWTATLPAGFINATATTYVQMQGAGPWAPAMASQVVGWSSNVSMHLHGSLCNNWSYVTAKYNNDAAAFTVAPGVNCLTNETNGVSDTATPQDWYNYLMSMNPLSWLMGAGATTYPGSIGLRFASMAGTSIDHISFMGGSENTNLLRLGFYGAQILSK